MQRPRRHLDRARRKLYETTVRFTDESHLRRIINKIVSQIGRRIDESSPMVDARLPDGSRVNAIIPPLSLSGPLMTIRKFSRRRLSLEDMINIGSLSEESVDFLAVHRGAAEHADLGRHRLGEDDPPERPLVVDPEQRAHRHDRGRGRAPAPPAPRPAARGAPPNIEGEGHIPIRDLVRNSLRMRPDRIIVGEVRGAEALDMLQAMNTGHDGSLSTVHSNSPRRLHRIETMVMMAGYDLPLRDPPARLGGARPPRPHRPPRGRLAPRRAGHGGAAHGVGRDPAPGHLRVRDRVGRARPHDHRQLATGLRPVFLEKFRKRGIELPQSMFGERVASLDEGAGRVRLRRIILASAALVALAVPAIAPGQQQPQQKQGPPLKLESSSAGFPTARTSCSSPRRDR